MTSRTYNFPRSSTRGLQMWQWWIKRYRKVEGFKLGKYNLYNILAPQFSSALSNFKAQEGSYKQCFKPIHSYMFSLPDLSMCLHCFLGIITNLWYKFSPISNESHGLYVKGVCWWICHSQHEWEGYLLMARGELPFHVYHRKWTLIYCTVNNRSQYMIIFKIRNKET